MMEEALNLKSNCDDMNQKLVIFNKLHKKIQQEKSVLVWLLRLKHAFYVR